MENENENENKIDTSVPSRTSGDGIGAKVEIRKPIDIDPNADPKIKTKASKQEIGQSIDEFFKEEDKSKPKEKEKSKLKEDKPKKKEKEVVEVDDETDAREKAEKDNREASLTEGIDGPIPKAKDKKEGEVEEEVEVDETDKTKAKKETDEHEELKEFKEPEGVPEKQKIDWRKIKTKAATALKERDAIKAEKDALVASFEELKKKGMTPEMQAEFNELRALQRSTDIRRDPEFRKKYDKPIQDAAGAIYGKLGLLPKQGDEPETIEWKKRQISNIAKIGGPHKLPWQSEAIQKLMADNNLTTADGAFINLKIGQLTDLELTRNQAIQEAVKAESYVPSTVKQAKEYETKVENEIEQMSKTNPHLVTKPVPETGTNAEKLAAVEHNRGAELIKEGIRTALTPQNPKHQVEIAFLAAVAPLLDLKNQEKDKQIKELKEELAELNERFGSVKVKTRPSNGTPTGGLSKVKEKAEATPAIGSKEAKDVGGLMDQFFKEQKPE